MKSPKDQKIIQIELTNACSRSCSNCTRFCGHHSKSSFMPLDTFKKAVDSLDGYPGMVGVMGGEPTLHPQFEECVSYLASRVGPSSPSYNARKPIRDFAAHRIEYLSDVTRKRGLWSSLGPGYYRHFELIQEVFEYQCINDHSNPGLHQALLITRKELGIPDDEWIKLRDNCWIQNLWSSSITPKGAFFCEIAASLDMLFNGPGGWPIESGWWKRTPAEFGDQLQWCELCSAALHVPRRKANEEIDDISPILFAKLKAIDSPKIRKGRVNVIDLSTYSAEAFKCEPSYEWYLPDEDNSQRVAGTNKSLFPKSIDAIIVSSGRPELLGKTLAGNAAQVDRIAVSEVGNSIGTSFQSLEARDWVVVLGEDVVLANDFKARMTTWILNPGCLYEFHRTPAAVLGSVLASSVSDSEQVLFRLFNASARAIRGKTDIDFASWPSDKVVNLTKFLAEPDEMEKRRERGEWVARHVLAQWKALCDAGLRLALFGAGQHTMWLLALLRSRNLPMPAVIVDDTPFHTEMSGIQLTTPEESDSSLFDAVVISCNPSPMTQRLVERCRQTWGNDKPSVELYPFLGSGNFMKVIPAD